MIYDEIIDKLLDMNPDPIPKFVLLKEFKGISPSRMEYQNAYDKVCSHPFVIKYEESQSSKGHWPSYHGDTEWAIRKLLSYGLDSNHICLKRALDYSIRLLHGEEEHDYSEKQDNVRWWPEMFMPLVLAATISLIDKSNEHLTSHCERWANFTERAFEDGNYDHKTYKTMQNEHFGFKTKCIITPFNYYNLLLMAPYNGVSYLNESTSHNLVDYCMNEAEFIGYVFNKNPGELVSLNEQNRDSRSFCHWIRALNIISKFRGWCKYEHKYFDWVWGQRNPDGLWAFPKKYDLFALSDSWRGNKRAIDSSIFVLRMLMRKRAF